MTPGRRRRREGSFEARGAAPPPPPLFFGEGPALSPRWPPCEDRGCRLPSCPCPHPEGKVSRGARCCSGSGLGSGAGTAQRPGLRLLGRPSGCASPSGRGGVPEGRLLRDRGSPLARCSPCEEGEEICWFWFLLPVANTLRASREVPLGSRPILRKPSCHVRDQSTDCAVV
ncbi:protein yippee-like 1 isoform X1 [Aquila chrysaetos chrysaetos]|uniref:protein yippee-like 1 isoform X1 n=1 Tax=Aquila chrysaetos chrysaetos TaxID=223781 RepID=UPI0011770E47|nr:protein yippee-like 1 isoform X1 [Aquila chrysaetos chrysaetos]